MTTYLGYDTEILKRPRPAIRQVTRLDNGRFLLKYKHLPNFEMELNFTPFIRIFNLTGAFTLLHWQAMPKGLRTWGAYTHSPDRDDYAVFDYPDFKPTTARHQILQIDEVLVNIRPTAVVYYPDMIMVQDDSQRWELVHDYN